MSQISIIRITRSNHTLLNDTFFQLFPYADRSDNSTRALTIAADDRSYLYIAYDGDAITGYALGYRFPALFDKGNMAYVYDIEVLPADRRKGIGKALMESLLNDLKTDGVTEAWLGTDTGNVPAQALYHATGGERSDDTFYDFTYTLA